MSRSIFSANVVFQRVYALAYKDPRFSQHYTGATKAGLLRGAYHFARPNSSSGAEQARFFLAHGGGWSKDGMTLPGALDLEGAYAHNDSVNRSRTTHIHTDPPRGQANYGLSTSQMVAWIKDFSDTYHAATGVYPGTLSRSVSTLDVNNLTPIE